MKNKKLTLGALAAGAIQMAVSGTALAGGPLAVCSDGVPFLWPNGGQDIEINLDKGGLGALSNAEADAFILDALQTWADIPTATISYQQGSDIMIDGVEVDVVLSNVDPILNPTAPNGQSEIVYDETGEIFDDLFGPGSGVLGFAGPDFGDFTDCTLLEGSAFLNGPEFEVGDPGNFGAGIIFHEFGHFNNLAHTQTNGAILLGDTTGPTPDDSFGPFDISIFNVGGVETNALDTMYPFIFGGLDFGTSTPALSDVSSISQLYPAAGYFTDFASLSGSVLAPDGVTRVSGVNVIARNVDDPFVDAVSTLSGDFTDAFDPNVSDVVGTYTFTGLTPGATYQVYIDSIVDGGFSTPPLQPLPGPEEFYSGADESSSDDVLLAADIPVAAGATASGIDVILNEPKPGDPLPTGPFGDGSTQLFLPFPFEFCGMSHNSVWVNGNGNVTFLAPSGSFEESAGEHLVGAPRIAGLWDDMIASAGGILTFDTDGESFFQVIWNDVPELDPFLGPVGSNSFAITLYPKRSSSTKIGSPFTVEYGDVSSVDGVAGYSCGGPSTTRFEMETDISGKRGRKLRGGAALYEQFTNNELDNEMFDLVGRELKFVGVGELADRFERGRGSRDNNTLANATRIRPPFDSNRRISTIDFAGGDVDFYSFEIDEGDIFAIETVTGTLDSILGLFDADTGDLLLISDDEGDGLLSRFIFQAPFDLNAAIAVSTFPDFEFIGAGNSAGRYVLSVQKYEGEVLDIGDDDSVEVAMDHSFEFQGNSYDSVFVNSNGNLTFGAPDVDFSESVEDLLSGPPRIASLWDDFDPTGAFGNFGFYIVERDDDETNIHGVSISEFFSSTPNYFSVELEDDGEIEIEYGATARSDALVGVSEGQGAADPGPTDLSDSDDDLEAEGTTYENFPFFPTKTTPFSDFDLYFDDVEFED